MKKKYKCCICHRTFKEGNYPIRLAKQEYGAGRYTQYYTTARYDFCRTCYKTFNFWINKHSEENKNEYEGKSSNQYNQHS